MVTGNVTESIEADNGIGPTEQTINRQKLQLEEIWRQYDIVFTTYLDLLEAEAAEVEMPAYEEHLRRFESTLKKAGGSTILASPLILTSWKLRRRRLRCRPIRNT